MIAVNPVKRPSATIWPSRDFSFGYALKGLEDVFDSPTKVVDGDPRPLGLSDALNSHKLGEDVNIPTRKRARRGQKGISAHGRLLVQNAASLLERTHGKRHLSFLTLTLPGVSAEESKVIAHQWANQTRKFLQGLKRALLAHRLPGEIVSVSEIQERRFRETGVIALHLHCVFVGRHPRQDWVLTPLQLRALWKRSFPAEFQEKTFVSTENVVGVQKSVARYLAKYLSKGVSVSSDEEGVKDIVEFLPTCWYNCSNTLREKVRQLKLSGESASQMVQFILEHAHPDSLQWLYPVYIEIDGHKVLMGWRGKLTKDAYREIFEIAASQLQRKTAAKISRSFAGF